MRRKLTLALAALLAMISVSALALGLGEIRLNSYLNQRLDAEIELVSATADELAGLTVRLADRNAFERQGLERSAVLSSLNFEVIRRPNGTAYVKVTSKEPIKEPFLTFLVEARWARGRLLREYTLLLDPPVFAEREETAPAEAPVAEQSSATELVADQTLLRETAEPETGILADEPVEEAADEQLAEAADIEEEGDVVSVPPLEAEEQPVRREPARVETPEMGGNYGPIQRNETLWGIAQRLRPDESITMNQMMLAIYRTNPEAFYGNINRMKAGYILRIPEYSEVTSISRAEAFREAKRMNEEWRSGTTAPVSREADAEPAESEHSLSLVAPEEEPAAGLDTGVGAGGEEGMAVEEEPLVVGEDEVDQGAVELGVEEQTPERLTDIEDETLQALQDQEPALPETSEETLPELGAVEPEATEEPAEELLAEETPAEETLQAPVATTEPEEQTAEEPAPEQDSRMAAPVRRPAEKSMVDQIMELAMSPIGMGAGAAIVLLLIVVALIMRKRKSEAQARAAAAMGDWGTEDEGDVTVVAGRGEDETEDATVVSGGDEDAGMGAVFAHDMEHEDTGTQRLEDDAEATQLLADADKTQMLPKDKAEDLTETVVGSEAVSLDENDPLSEADFHMAYGLYDQAAEVVEKAVQRDPSRKDYKVKLAEIYYAANNNEGFMQAARMLKEQVGDSSDSDWNNIVIMGRQIAPNDPLFAEGGSTGGGDVDLDFGMEDSGESADVGTETVVGGGAPADEDLDFELPVSGGEESPEEPALAADDGLDFDLDIGGETAEAPAAEEEPAEETAATDSGMDFDFDIGGLGEEETETAEEETVTAGDSEEFSLPSDDDESTQTEFDKALQELSAYVDTNIPEGDAGDSVSAEEDSGELNLGDFSFDKESEDLGSDEELGSSGEEDEEGLGEVGTKLDLARAYIDMGDPDGARSILEEVIADGDEDQKKEAQELIDQL